MVAGDFGVSVAGWPWCNSDEPLGTKTAAGKKVVRVSQSRVGDTAAEEENRLRTPVGRWVFTVLVHARHD